MDEERRTLRGEVFQEEPRSGLVRLEALELPSDPTQQRQVDVPEQGRQGRGCVSPVIPDPPSKERIEFLGDIGQRQMRLSPNVLVPDRGPHGFERRRADRRVEPTE